MAASRGSHRTRTAGRRQRVLVAIGLVTALSLSLVTGATPTFAAATAPPVSLGTASTYLVLGQSGVTSTGNTIVSGDLGIGAGSSLVGFPPGVIGGDIHKGDAAATGALADAKAAFDQAAALPATAPIDGDLAGLKLTAGVYHAAGAITLSKTLTLDAANDANASFVIQIDAALSTAASSQIVLINGAVASRVFWEVTGAAALGAGSTFAGTLMTAGAIDTGSNTRISGRTFARGATTLTNNVITFTSAGPPSVTIDGGARSFNPSYTPTLSGTVTTTSTSTTAVSVTIGTQTLTATVTGGSGSWSVTAATLVDGTFTVRAAVTDPVSNRASATQALIVGKNSGLVSLGSTSTYAVFGGGGITSTDTTGLSGDLGTSPSALVTADPAINVGGDTHLNDTAAITARTDLDNAYNDAQSRTPTQEITGSQAGQTLTAGVFHTSAALALTGILTLDAKGVSDAVFLFQIGGAFTTAASSQILLKNGALASHVFWQTAGATGLGAGSTFAGTVLAAGAINAGASARIGGQLLAQGSVTLAGNIVTFTSLGAPSVTIDGGDRSFSAGHTPTITGTVTTTSSVVAAITVTIAGQTLTTTVAGGRGAWSVTAKTIADATYKLRAVVTDPVGNRASAYQTFSVGSNASLVSLGNAAPFSVLAGGGVTSTNSTNLTGDLGTSPSTTVNESPAIAVGGTRHLNDDVAVAARKDMDTAYADAKRRTATRLFSGDQAGQTFSAGVFHTDAALSLTGTFTLDAQGNPDAVFLFQVGGAFSTGAASTIALTNGALASHVFWQVVGAVDLGANSTFVGTVLGYAAITAGDKASFAGQLLGAGIVTFSDNAVVNPPVPDPPTPTGALTITVPTTTADLGTVGPSFIVSGHLGQVSVSDTRDLPQGSGWAAIVSASPFTSSVNGPSIPASAASYSSGYVTSDVAARIDNPTRTDLTNPQSVVTTNAFGANSAHWNPTLTVTVPTNAASAIYTTIVTHSVA